jgi:ATP-binding cassette subfamily F protein 3
LSGGQKTRLALSGVLLSSPQLLLLDEPTNHLDIEMLEWLEIWLVDSPLTRSAAALVVSHDRIFLDRTVSGILELDPNTHRLRQYAGDYSSYLEQKQAERDHQWQAYTDQQEEIARLSRAAASVRSDAVFKRGGKADSGDKSAKGFFANRSKEHVKRAKQIEKRLERLLTEDKVDKPRQSWQMKLDFDQASASGRQALVLEDLAVGYGELALLRQINLVVRYGDRIALVGPNGSGKTSLLNTIAGQLPPLAGASRLGSAVRLGYMAQEQDTLDPALDALQTIRRLAPLSETDARTYLHQYLFSGDDVFTPVSSLSYGERARLMLACLVASGCNLLLLDEPVNHLDIPSRARFEQALANFSGTVIAAVHDRYFISSFAATLWEIHQLSLVVTPIK